MDYERLLSLADKAKNFGAIRGRGAASMANGKKANNAAKSGVDPVAVARFLASKKREEYQKAEESRQNKERLLQLRRQNTKANKAAKMMATRTKDNDFSRIVLNEDQIREKEAIEEKLRRQRIDDPKERMKHRIEMEAAAQNSTKKRKRKRNDYGRYPGEDEDFPPVNKRSLDDNPYRDDFAYKPQIKPKPATTAKATMKPTCSAASAKQKKGPPPLDFNKILEIAEKKNKEEKKPSLLEEIESAKSMRCDDFRAKRIEKKRNEYVRCAREDEDDPPPVASVSNRNRVNNRDDLMYKPQVKSKPAATQRMNMKPTSSVASSRQVEEYSPTEPFINSKKNASKLREPIPSAKYKPTPRQEMEMAKYKREQMEKAEEMRKNKERLIQMQSQNAKAKMMVSRTKDCDVSRRVPNEDQIRRKEIMEERFRRERLMDQKERIKYRMELEAAKNNKKRKLEYSRYPQEEEEDDDEEEEEEEEEEEDDTPPPSKYRSLDKNPYRDNRDKDNVYKPQMKPKPSAVPKAAMKPTSSASSSRRVEEYSPTEPSMNGRKKVVKPREPIPPQRQYKPTSRQEMSKYSRESESPEPDPEPEPEPEPRRGIYAQYKPQSQKKLPPIGATLYKKNVRDASPEHSKQTDITSHRVMNNLSFNRLMQSKEQEKEREKEKIKPPEPKNKISKPDFRNDELIKRSVQKVMQKPQRKLPPIGANYRRGMYGEKNDIQYEDSLEDEEEDDEMRDFIDDGDYENVVDDDYSKYIREIFGYDKRKYLDEDDDDEAMEASFDQQQREELRSAKIGILEDLRDMQMEAAEKRRKAQLRKKRQIIDDDEDEDDDDD